MITIKFYDRTYGVQIHTDTDGRAAYWRIRAIRHYGQAPVNIIDITGDASTKREYFEEVIRDLGMSESALEEMLKCLDEGI